MQPLSRRSCSPRLALPGSIFTCEALAECHICKTVKPVNRRNVMRRIACRHLSRITKHPDFHGTDARNFFGASRDLYSWCSSVRSASAIARCDFVVGKSRNRKLNSPGSNNSLASENAVYQALRTIFISFLFVNVKWLNDMWAV